jgi:PhnB protein
VLRLRIVTREIMMAVAYRPEGYPDVSVYMMVEGAPRAIDFMREVLGGETLMRMDREDGSIMHAAVRIGDSVVMLSDATPDYPAVPAWLHVYVPDVDASYARALEQGAVPMQAPSEKGDGDRRSGVTDPAGITWWLSTHVGR